MLLDGGIGALHGVPKAYRGGWLYQRTCPLQNNTTSTCVGSYGGWPNVGAKLPNIMLLGCCSVAMATQ